MTELKKLKEDDEYREDTRLTSDQYVRLCKKKDKIEDQSLELAKENIEDAEDLEGDHQIYNETSHPNYIEQRDKAKELLSQVEAKANLFSRENALKVLRAAANEKYKVGTQAQKNFNKGSGMTKDEFLDQFINSRKEFYALQSYQEVVKCAPDATQ